MPETMQAVPSTGPDPEPIRAALVEAVRSSDGRLLGTNVRPALGKDFKLDHWNCRTVRQFIQTYVPDLRIIGASGQDIVYGLADESGVPPHEGISAGTPGGAQKPVNLWRVWVSPRSNNVLVVNPETGEVHSAMAGGNFSAHQIVIEPLDVASHKVIANDFMNNNLIVTDELRNKLQRFIDSSDPNWFKDWTAALGQPALSDWYKERKVQLELALENRLRDHGVPAEMVQKIVSSVSVSRMHKSEPHQGGEPRSGVPGSLLAGWNSGRPSVSLLHEVVREVVGIMTEDQLRAMVLPFGPVVDAILARLSKGETPHEGPFPKSADS